MKNLRYSEMNAALQRIGHEQEAAGCHGSMCGVLVVKANTAFAVWLKEVMGDLDSADILTVETKRLLCQAFEVVREQLLDPGLGFRLLLPDDNAAFAQRVQAVAQWCHGFMFGMALSGVDLDVEFSQDSQEILTDVAEIARVGVSRTHDEIDESALFEIIEYLRIGVLVILEEFRVDQAIPQVH